MEIDSKIGKFLRFGLENSKKDFDKAVTNYSRLKPQDRIMFAKDVLVDGSPEGRKTFCTYSFATEIPTDNADIVEEAQLQLKTDRDAIVSGMFVSARFKQLGYELSDGYWDLGSIGFSKNNLYTNVQIGGSSKQNLPLEDSNVAPLLEVIDAVVIDRLNESKDLRRKLGSGAIGMKPHRP